MRPPHNIPIMSCISIMRLLIFLISSVVCIANKDKKMSFEVQPLEPNVYKLGEGPHWEANTQSLYFVDAFVGRVLRFDEKSGQTNEYNLKDLVTIVIPFKGSQDLLLVSLRNKVIKYNTKTQSHELLAQISPESEGKERFNDGKIDALGRLWIGSVFDGPNGAVPRRGSLYKLDKNNFIKMSDNFTLSNGITWNLNNTKMYFNDSEDRKVYAFDFDLQNGTISNKQVFIDLKSNKDFNDGEYPDGMTTDKNDKLWIALYGGGRVVQINQKNGKVEKSISFGSPLTTSVAFGGPLLDTLYVTTGYDGLSDDDKARFTNAGKLFRVKSNDENFGAISAQPLFDPN